MAQVLMRGRFCEVIAGSAKLPLGDSDPFLLGMFSLLDAILQRPLEGSSTTSILAGISGMRFSARGMKRILCLLLLRIVKSYEAGDLREVDAAARVIGLSPGDLSTCYLESLSWVESVFSSDERTWRAAHATRRSVFHRSREASLA